MNKILNLVDNIKSNASDKQVLTLVDIIIKCIDIIDNLQEDNSFYEEELERLRFERDDRRLERSGILDDT